MSRPQRAAPMAADDRRAAILRATVPLLRERGMNVTTRELAEAAGVAEGTLFRVFPDKEALVHAAVAHALDPAPLVAELAAIDPALDLAGSVTRAVELMIARSRDVVALLSISYGEGGHGHHRMHHPPGPARAPGASHPVETIIDAVTELLTERRGTDRLRLEPAVCARMLVSLVLVGSRPSIGDGSPLTADEIADLFLNGATTRVSLHVPSSVPPQSAPEEPC